MSQGTTHRRGRVDWSYRGTVGLSDDHTIPVSAGGRKCQETPSLIFSAGTKGTGRNLNNDFVVEIIQSP